VRVVFGIDIGGTTIKMGCFDEEKRLIQKWELPSMISRRAEPMLEAIRMSLEIFLMDNGIAKKDVLGVGMTAPGPVREDGFCYGAVNIGWEDTPLRTVAETVFGVSPVYVGNDATVAALGEYLFGAGRAHRSMLMVTLGTGVGGGIILDGQVLTGEAGGAGEIGHTCVNRAERNVCGCGKKGCLEQYVSAVGIVRMAEQILASENTKSLLRGEEVLTSKHVWDAAKAGDVLALRVVDKVSDTLAMALANAGCILDPACIVIGGGVSQAGEILLKKVEAQFCAYIFPRGKKIPFFLAELGNDAGIYGGASLVFQSICADCIKENEDKSN